MYINKDFFFNAICMDCTLVGLHHVCSHRNWDANCSGLLGSYVCSSRAETLVNQLNSEASNCSTIV